MNDLKPALLLGALTGIFLLVGGMAGGQQGMMLAERVSRLRRMRSL